MYYKEAERLAPDISTIGYCLTCRSKTTNVLSTTDYRASLTHMGGVLLLIPELPRAYPRMLVSGFELFRHPGN